MSSQNCGLSIRSLAELALILSRVARCTLTECAAPTTATLRVFWQSSRKLEQRWMTSLDDWSTVGMLDIERLERLAPRVFATEMVIRTWCTTIAGLDRQRGGDDMVRIARNVVGGMTRVRNGILSRLLSIPPVDSNRVLGVDRLRRRCDRWTDMLLGQIALECDCYEFAFDESRARDFGEECSMVDPGTGPNVAEHLMSAGLRLSFLQHLSPDSVYEPELLALVQTILSSIPKMSLHRDGSLRTSLEQRIAVSRKRMECRATISKDMGARNDEETKAMSLRIDLSRKQPDAE